MDYKVTDSELTGIANAIRTKGGTSSPLVFPNGFSSAIADIPSGGGSTLITKSITENGTYDAEDDNADGYSSVTVSVPTIALSSIAVTSQPTTTQYDVGDTLDLTGVEVTATYSNGAVKVVTSACTFSPDDGDTLSNEGTQTISISYTEGGVTKSASTTVTVQSALVIVPFASGTDSQIVTMIQAAHNGTIDLQQDGNWSVGDARTIVVGEFTDERGHVYAQQNADIVISQFGDYMNCGCVMQFDFKDLLGTSSTSSGGSRMNATGTNVGGYGSSLMKTTTIPALVNALPSWLRNLLIEFSVLASAGNQSSVIETVTGNKLALRSVVEVTGSTSQSVSGEGSRIEYYNTSANRKKKFSNSNTSYWWTRSPRGSSDAQFCSIGPSGDGDYDNAASVRGLSPFGCI